MIRIVAKALVIGTKKAAFLKIAEELIASSRKEDGCIAYALYEDIGNPNVLTFIEDWKDQDAIDRHNQSVHFTTLCPRLRECQAAPSEVTCYRVVDEIQ